MHKICLTALLSAISVAQAQTPLPVADQNLTNLQTPTLLGSSHSAATVDLRFFGGYDKTIRGSLWLGYGLTKDLEVDLAGSFAKWGSAVPFPGTTIRFGGTDEELSIRYKLPGDQVPITVQGGLAYIHTPAQPERLAGTLGASFGYSPSSRIRLYLNPRAVFLDNNSLVGIGVGASVDLAPKMMVIGDWTPLVAGDNDISTTTGNRSRSQLYGAGLRFQGLWMGGNLDVGVTNATGLTTGSSLTPSIGDAPALYVRFSYRF